MAGYGTRPKGVAVTPVRACCAHREADRQNDAPVSPGYVARTNLQEAFDANQPVTSLTLTITTATDAEAVTEPLALDIGLGFPFWPKPVGQQVRGQPDSNAEVQRVLKVHVVDRKGVNVVGANVQILPPDQGRAIPQPIQSGQTNRLGYFFAAVPPNTYNIKVFGTGI